MWPMFHWLLCHCAALNKPRYLPDSNQPFFLKMSLSFIHTAHKRLSNAYNVWSIIYTCHYYSAVPYMVLYCQREIYLVLYCQEKQIHPLMAVTPERAVAQAWGRWPWVKTESHCPPCLWQMVPAACYCSRYWWKRARSSAWRSWGGPTLAMESAQSLREMLTGAVGVALTAAAVKMSLLQPVDSWSVWVAGFKQKTHSNKCSFEGRSVSRTKQPAAQLQLPETIAKFSWIHFLFQLNFSSIQR